MEKKNVIVLYTGCGEEKHRVELYNFQTMDVVIIEAIVYIRIKCDGRFYYYPKATTSIHEINVYNIDHK